MKVVVQRVKEAKVSVNHQTVAQIEKGLLLLVGITKDDTDYDIQWMAEKISNLRIFEDQDGKCNLNILQAGGEILSVSQFTLCADMQKGNRPGFDNAAKPETAKESWQTFNTLLVNNKIPVKEGIFGSHMDVTLTNQGPVTIWLDSKSKKSNTAK